MEMVFDSTKIYFVSKSDFQLQSKSKGGKKINHLLLGDWLHLKTGEDGKEIIKNGRINVICRRSAGWLGTDEITEERGLEVNFVDIGQGDGCHIVTPDDDVIVIDAGVGTNMNRFLSWRYNLRNRNVKRAPDFDPENRKVKEPWKIDHVVISHPDNDHYYEFFHLFENPKLCFGNVWHNGIVERPKGNQDPSLPAPESDDLGGYAGSGKNRFLWDVIDTTKKMKDLVNRYPRTTKQYISTLRACLANTKDVTIKALLVDITKLGTPFLWIGSMTPVNWN